MPRLRLYFYRNGRIVDVIDAWPSAFYSYVPDWIDLYRDCAIHARFTE